MSHSTRRAAVAVAAAVVMVSAAVAVAAEDVLLPEPDGEVLTLLLLGSDSGPPRGGDPLAARADGFQLLFVSGDRQHATFVSVPRDSWVTVPGRGASRINACLNAGPQRCVETVESEFDVEVDGYLVTSMNGWKAAVSAFGGIEVDVPRPLEDGGQDIEESGLQRLSGSQALTYGRDRKNRPGGDFGRSEAQAELLALAHEQALEDATIGSVLDAVGILRRYTVTDLEGTDVARLAFEALRLPPDGVERALAEGSPARIGGASVVRLASSAYDVIADASDDGRLSPSGQ